MKGARTNNIHCIIMNEQGTTNGPNQPHRIQNAHFQSQQFCIRLCYLRPFSAHNHRYPFFPPFLPQHHPSIHTRSLSLSTHLLELLLRPQLVRMPALLFTTYKHTENVSQISISPSTQAESSWEMMPKKGGKNVQLVARGGRRA